MTKKSKRKHDLNDKSWLGSAPESPTRLGPLSEAINSFGHTPSKDPIDLKHAYIVFDSSPRFNCVVLVTMDKQEAIDACAKSTDHCIIQQSERDYPSRVIGNIQ